MSRITSDVDPIEYEALQDAVPGDTVAVQVRPLDSHDDTTSVPTIPPPRTLGNPPWRVFAGEVRETDNWHADVDPEGLIVDGNHIPEYTTLASITVDPHILWQITTDGVEDASSKVTNVPPLNASSKAPDEGPAPCLLSYRPDQHSHLVVHEARADRGEIYHMSRSIGVIVEAAFGASVEAEDVLPPGYESPA